MFQNHILKNDFKIGLFTDLLLKTLVIFIVVKISFKDILNLMLWMMSDWRKSKYITKYHMHREEYEIFFPAVSFSCSYYNKLQQI